MKTIGSGRDCGKNKTKNNKNKTQKKDAMFGTEKSRETDSVETYCYKETQMSVTLAPIIGLQFQW